MSYEQFAFLGVMFGVILSLGVAALLTELGTLLQRRGQPPGYWVYASWVLLQLMLYLHIWWSLWSLQQAIAEWNFFLFIVLLLGPAALFLATRVFLSEPGPGADTEQHYFTVRRIFFGLLACVVVWELVAGPLLFGVRDPLLWLQLCVLVVLLVLATSKNRRVHGWLTVAIWVLFVTGVIGDGLHMTSSP